MTATVQYTHGAAYAVAQVSSLAFIEESFSVLEELAAQTRASGARRLLINLLDVVGTFGRDEQQAIGLLTHRQLGHLERVASLVAEDKITRVSEAAARSQGMELRVFTSLPNALAWLTS